MWYCGNNDPGGAKPVGTKLSNPWGLHDMHGNLWEWCQDYLHGSYANGPLDGDAWESPTRSNSRVIRGGVWSFNVQSCRSGNRLGLKPVSRDYFLGFRLAMTPENKAKRSWRMYE